MEKEELQRIITVCAENEMNIVYIGCLYIDVGFVNALGVYAIAVHDKAAFVILRHLCIFKIPGFKAHVGTENDFRVKLCRVGLFKVP